VGRACTCSGAPAAGTLKNDDLLIRKKSRSDSGNRPSNDRATTERSKKSAQPTPKKTARTYSEMHSSSGTSAGVQNVLAEQQYATKVKEIASQKELLAQHKATLAHQKVQASRESQAMSPSSRNAAEARMAMNLKQKADAAEALAKEKARCAHEKALRADREVKLFEEVQAKAGRAAETRAAMASQQKAAVAEATTRGPASGDSGGVKKHDKPYTGGGGGSESSARGVITAEDVQTSSSDDNSVAAGVVGTLIYDQVLYKTGKKNTTKRRITNFVFVIVFLCLASTTCKSGMQSDFMTCLLLLVRTKNTRLRFKLISPNTLPLYKWLKTRQKSRHKSKPLRTRTRGPNLKLPTKRPLLFNKRAFKWLPCPTI